MVKNKAMSVALALSLAAGLCPSMAYVQAAYADEDAQAQAQVADVIAAGQQDGAAGAASSSSEAAAASDEELASDAQEAEAADAGTATVQSATAASEAAQDQQASEAAEEAATADTGEELAEESEAAELADASAATTLTFSNSGVTASSDAATGFKVSGTELTINEPGTYVVTGSCAEGNVKVKKGTTGVTLILRDLNLACSTTAPVAINKDNGDTTVRIEGEVVLADNEDATTEETNVDFEGAALKVKSGSNLTITGTGTLTADGTACKNAIKGGEGCTITIQPGVTINAQAANNGIASDGALVVNGGTLNVTAGNDGLKSEPDEGDIVSAGTITVNDGNITVVSAGDGIQATGDVAINGGTFDITANGGAKNGTTLTDDSDSCNGIKSDSKLTINGGTFALDTADDAIHSNGDASVLGGTYQISSGDDAIHSDYVLNIGMLASSGTSDSSGPSITVTKSVEGLEGATVNFNCGSAKVTASDDGVNAANSDLASYDFAINLAGGSLWVNAEGDGLDSNSAINVTGGTYEVFGSSGNVEAAVDTIENTGTWTVSGGKMLAVGNSNMTEVPTSGTYVAFGQVGMMGGAPGQMGQMPGKMGQMPGQTGQMGQMPGQQGFAGGATRPSAANSSADAATADTAQSQGGQVQESTDATQAQAGPNMGVMPGQTGGMPAQNGAMPGQMGGSAIVKAGSSISIKDSSGNEVFSSTGVKNASSVVYAGENLKTGETYMLYVDGTAVGTATAGAGGAVVPQGASWQGGMQPGQNGTQPPAMPSQTQNGTTGTQPSQNGTQPPALPGQEQGQQGATTGTQPAQSGTTSGQSNLPSGITQDQPILPQIVDRIVEQASSVWSRLQGADAYGTMEQVVGAGWTSSDTVVVATFGGYWDALAATSLAGACDAPVLLTSGTQLSAPTKALIQKLGATKAYIVGGTSAVSAAVEAQVADALSGAKSVERVAGDTAVGTAQAVAAKVGAGSSMCIVATSGGYWDALAAGPLAYAKQAPIYLTRADGTLDAQTLAAIKAAGYSQAVIVGGTAAVDASTEAALTGAGVAHVTRQAGVDAYETSKALASWAIQQGLSADKMGVATAGGYWDALTGAALCGKNGSVLVLADAGHTQALDVARANSASVVKAYVFGGTSAVAPEAFNAAVAATGK